MLISGEPACLSHRELTKNHWVLDNYPYHSLVRPGFQMDFPSIALLTDFGERDGFVGVMKGVILSQLQQPVPIVDISHQIEPQNIRQGMWVLESSYPYFPAKTVFVCVVDPAVGNPNQAPLLLFWPERQQAFLGPDNGLFTPIYEAAGSALQILDIRRSTTFQEDRLSPKGRSGTFYGRDVYSPIAAQLANAFMNPDISPYLTQFGNLETAPIQCPRQKPHRSLRDGIEQLHGEVVAYDHFGNVITNIPSPWASHTHPYQLSLNEEPPLICQLQSTYSLHSAPKSGSPPLLLIPSSGGTLELAIFGENAQQRLSADLGDAVTLSPLP